MEILELETFDRDELLARLKATRLVGFDHAQPYENAALEIVAEFNPEAATPAQRYVLTPGVDTVLALRAALLPHGHDLFALDGGLRVRTSDAPDEVIPVIPPVVEESLEPDGRTVLIINDGIHRLWAARSLGLPISTVVVRGVPEEYPYYAYALANGWDGVQALAELPDVFQKKEYRQPDGYKAYFRQFNEAFPGVQKARKSSNPSNLTA